jgi:hypothetical protein
MLEDKDYNKFVNLSLFTFRRAHVYFIKLYLWVIYILSNEGISAASFSFHVAALVPDVFYNLYLVKNHIIANNSATTETREKIITYLESIEIKNLFDICLTKFENYQILLNKISHRFLVTTKLFSG